MDEEPNERLQRARARAGFRSARAAATRFGWAASTYASHENATRGFGADEARDYGQAFKVSPEWLLFGTGPVAVQNALPIMGYIGAGAEISPEFEQVPPEGLDQVELPFAIPPDLIGLEVRGESMLPRYEDGDVIVVWRDQHGAFDALLGEEAAVRTERGQRYLKRLLRGPRKGTYNLESTNAAAKTIEGVRLEWASEVYLTVRSAQIRRIAARERALATRRASVRARETKGMDELPLPRRTGSD
jgi:phage repressor protein C with HTH and peptisase S24 domain